MYTHKVGIERIIFAYIKYWCNVFPMFIKCHISLSMFFVISKCIEVYEECHTSVKQSFLIAITL